jgi:hypothetical protein
MLAESDIRDEFKQLIEDEAFAEREAARGLLDSEMDEIGGESAAENCPTCGGGGKRRKQLPALEQMAARVGLGFAYDLAYRMASQADIHATALAVDNALTRLDDGSILIRSEPDFGLSSYDSYELGAHLFLDLVRPVAEHWPDLGWGPMLDAVAESLEAIKRAHPAWRPRLDSETGDQAGGPSAD